MNRTVSFVIPCYKLGHLLSECIHSILAQTYQDFEVLIMDDDSPDDTERVAKLFTDPRVKYIRNQANLGNLRNYNKGICLAAGKYIWLISADDRLKMPYVLERYVRLMEEHLKVGYVFCPAVRLEDDREGEVIDYSYRGPKDQILEGRAFMAQLLFEGCTVVAPCGMARKECYEKVSLFPLDLPWGGDWYLWCIFALHYDAAYLAEPMVYYRRHGGSMTEALVTQQVRHCAESDVEVLRRLLLKAEEAGARLLATKCREAMADQYAKNITTRNYRASASSQQYTMTLPEFEDSVRQVARNPREAEVIRAQTFARAADRYYWQGDSGGALDFYRRALRMDFMMPAVWMKYLLLRLGKFGALGRAGLLNFRRLARRS